MNTGAYLVILFVGAVVVVIDGQVILHTGPTYLSEVYAREPARKITQLVVTVFHLVMLGLVAVSASIDLGVDPTVPQLVRRLGWILLLVAIGHVATMVGMSRLRREQEETELTEAQIHRDRGPGAGPADTWSRGSDMMDAVRGGPTRSRPDESDGPRPSGPGGNDATPGPDGGQPPSGSR